MTHVIQVLQSFTIHLIAGSEFGGDNIVNVFGLTTALEIYLTNAARQRAVVEKLSRMVTNSDELDKFAANARTI